MSGIKGRIEQKLVKAIGKIKPALSESHFLKGGVLTPQEVCGGCLVIIIECNDSLFIAVCGSW